MGFPIASAACTFAGLLVLQFVGSVIYNLFLHPLGKYPGPWLWRATRIPKQLAWFRGTIGHEALRIHAQYGEVVRVAPGELSYIHPHAWRDIFGRSGRQEMVKDGTFLGEKHDGAWSLVAAPADDHARMRRAFAPAFSNTALVAQEPLLMQYADRMVVKMGEAAARDGKVDIVDFFNFCTFDIMAELCFGAPLGLVETAEYVPWVRIIFVGLKYVVFRAVLLEIPIFGPLLNLLTAAAMKKAADAHHQFASDLVAKRLGQTEHGKPDLWSFILKRNAEGKGLTRAEMHINASTFMVAGTETTATSLSGAIWNICRHPPVYRKLVDEIRTTFEASDEIALRPLGEMQYLNAVLRENLRVYVPGGGGLTRIVPPEGVDICGDFIPGGTHVTMAHYAGYLHSSNFARPSEFLPERWVNTDDPQFASDRREYYEPFSYGPRNCLGKNLAWLELRLLLVKTLWHYDVELLPDNGNWMDQKSYLTWEKGPLLVHLRPVHR